ncbi:uncharacterized protein LOC124302872 [Neodiprion virginianus]|uniref:uncharacterized protein LOC124302872 n=1 Tax=Neodiprion virginianus TaxID=2961670 RepID=UPI001EE75EB0|nr:uncharacterized protein LOC124302872 [Neodiprion virginianus]
MTVRDLKRDISVQRTHYVCFNIDDAAYAGAFRSEDPKEMHLVKALNLFFKRYDAGLLMSSKLNISIWRDAKFYNIFDGQARGDDCLPITVGSGGSAKLILVRDLTGVVFVILERSCVSNEPFVLFPITVINAYKIPSHPDDPEEPFKSIGAPKRRPSDYKIQEKFRALVQGTYHLMHPEVPAELRGRGHLMIAVAAIVYSRLISAKKWSSVIVDLIFNQAHIYMIDLVRALEKKLDDTFELKIDDLMGDVILGVYSAKINVTANVVPGQKKKGKSTIDAGIREFFQQYQSGILEIKQIFFPIWKEENKFYFLDPFGCDDEGFRVDPDDPTDANRYKMSKPCATMNSSVNELVETILQNTGNKDKDPFILHALRVLYIKTGSTPGGPPDNVIYREKRTNRRPLAQESHQVKSIDQHDAECRTKIDMVPKPRSDAEKTKEQQTQFPELMSNVDDYMMKADEPGSFIVKRPSVELLGEFRYGASSAEQITAPDEVASKSNDPEIRYIFGYHVVNPHRLSLRGEKNCLAEQFEERARGQQGLIIALTAMAYGKVKPPDSWRNIDVNQIIDVGDKAYTSTITWIQRGSPAEMEKKDKGDPVDDDDEEEGNEEEGDEEEEEDEENENEEKKKGKQEFKGKLQPAPSHLDVTMLPEKIMLGENEVQFKKKLNFANGDANPLANLGEALEQYFERYDELIVENKKLMFGVWKGNGKYYIFNPYGSDEEGRRMRGFPATFIVADTINELTNVFYEILEYNDPKFKLHFIGIESIQPGDKYIVPEPIEVPGGELPVKYQTIFLPVTDEDLFVPEPEPEPEVQVIAQTKKKKGANDDDDDEEEGEDDEEEDVDDDEDEEEEQGSEKQEEALMLEAEKPIIDPLLEVEEQEQPDAPDELDLTLLSGTVIIDTKGEQHGEEINEALIYEKLKYRHPPPFVSPPKKVLCVLLEAKKASKSSHSLLSRFSIDSMLSIKKDSGLPTGVPTQQPTITAVDVTDGDKVSKVIKLPPKKYLVSRLPEIGFTPIRAINETYVEDEDLNKGKENECRQSKIKKTPQNVEREDVAEVPTTVRIKPVLIPLGPPIKTPTPGKKPKPCVDRIKRRCKINSIDKEDPVLEKLMCKTEDLLLDLMFPDPDTDVKKRQATIHEKERSDEKTKNNESRVRRKDRNKKEASSAEPERCGFRMTEDEVGVINGNICLGDRETIEECHFKQCYFAAIICVLAKIRLNLDTLRGSVLDKFILAGDEVYQRTGKLRYKALRWFYNIEILGSKCNIALRQIVYANPEECSEDELLKVIANYLENDRSGILVFPSASYAFWYSQEKYYLFDPYSCDDDGHASSDGSACLMEFQDLDTMITRIKENTGEAADKVFRIHAIAIAHMEEIKRKRKKRRTKISRIETEPQQPQPSPEPEPVLSLIELSEWVTKVKKNKVIFDMTIPGFAAVPSFNASTLEVTVLENDITNPIRTEFKTNKIVKGKAKAVDQSNGIDLVRKKPYDRKFKENSFVSKPIDLCIIAWACVHDPTLWGGKTIRGICDAGRDFTEDCIFASEDTTASDTTDGVLPEFTIANYSFRAAFAPLHQGTLYAVTGWNLAMSLKKLFSTPIYSGAIIICGKAHIGVMKRKENFYAWWIIPRTKQLKIITSEEMEDFLKLIVQEINEPNEIEFSIRAVTISYARKMAPDCEDTTGLHERAVPATSLAEIHRKSLPPYDIEALFRKTVSDTKPIFVQGTVAVRNREILTEPRVKRCYFVALLAVMVKRDIIQSAVAGTIDKIIEVAEGLYKEFDEPKAIQ